MIAPLRAGIAYFAVVFAAGFALGTIRVFVLAPAIGETLAVLCEIPVLLAVSWIVCGHIVGRFGVGPSFDARAAMGLVAFATLLMAEFLLSHFGFGRSLAEHLARYSQSGAAIGLAGQMVFGLIPLFRR